MSEVVGNSVGTTPATDRLSIDSALADWVYHRENIDQGLSLSDISPDAKMSDDLSRTQLNTHAWTRGGDGFIYNVADGFTAAVVNIGDVYTIVYRGTDMASFSPGDFDGGDVNADVTIGFGTRETSSQAADAVNLAKLVIGLADGDTSKVRVVGQSLGGGLAGIAAAVCGLSGTLIAPAPFGAQIPAQAAEAALVDIHVAPDTVPWFGSDPALKAFKGISDPNSVDSASSESLGDYIFAVYGDAAYQQFSSSYASYFEEYYANLLQPTLGVYRIDGEVLNETTDWLGAAIAGNSTQLKNTTQIYDVGTGDSVALHSPTLHALEMRSIYDPKTAGVFGTLLQNDAVLRDAFVGSSSAVVGPMDHARSDDGSIATTSRVGASGPSPGIVERALWKTIGDPTGLYAYFCGVFNTLLVAGKAAEGKGASTGTSSPTVHGSVVTLALQVLRDAVQNTSTVADFTSKNGYRFVGEDPSVPGQPYADKAIIHLADIHPEDTTNENASDGLPFGVDDLNRFAWNRIGMALPDANSGTDPTSTIENLVGTTFEDVFGTGLAGQKAKGLGWQIAVVQAGKDENATDAGMVYLPSQLPRPSGSLDVLPSSDSDVSHLIIGGDGKDTITGSSERDFILLGNGDNTVHATTGPDVIVGGSGANAFVVGADVFGTANTAAGASASYFLGGQKKDHFYGEVSSKVSFSFVGRQLSPVSSTPGELWDHYTETKHGDSTHNDQIYDVWVDPVEDYTIDLPTSGDGGIGNADEYKSDTTPQIDITADDHFTTAKLSGDFSQFVRGQDSTVDGGIAGAGYGNKLDLRDYVPTHSVSLTQQGGTAYTFGGALLNGNKIAGTGLTFKDFQVLYAPGYEGKGQSAGDVITGASDFKNIYLGNGHNLVDNVSGGVLPGQENSPEAHWQVIHLGRGDNLPI